VKKEKKHMNIQPFAIQIPQAAVDDLQQRLANTQWPDQLPGSGWSRGVPLSYMKSLVEYWGTQYNWREQEAQLNLYPHFKTEIDGQTIHFMHARSPEANAVPLLLLHGYPSSFVEFMKIIGPLSDPRSYGGDPADAYHVVVPSLPGYGFSTPLGGPGWELTRTSKAMVELMRRLGYDRYFANGADIGAGVVGDMGIIDSEHMKAAHISTDATSLALLYLPIDDPDNNPALTPGERLRWQQLRELQAEGKGYLAIQGTKPQTLAYGLADSPSGQLAWIVEKYQSWANFTASLPEDTMDIDQILTNISIYWFTRTGASAANFIWEASHSSAPWGAESPVPTGFAAFNVKDVEKSMRQMVDPENKVEHWSDFDQGGHFPAMEAPEALLDDMRSYFRRMR
jgi:pimeloyl-ACP methyl ester carboxylesterase